MKRSITILSLIILLSFPGFSQEEEKQSNRMKFPDYPRPQTDYGLTWALKAEYLKLGYERYFPLLGNYNDSINHVDGTAQFEIGFMLKQHYLSLGYGNALLYYDTDSLEIYYTNNVYSLNYGYNVVNSWRFTVRPTVSLKWSRSRLLNTSKGDALLSEYLENRDLDLRFNLPIGYAGVDVSYNFYDRSKDYDLFKYWKIGVYAGYAFPLIPKPILMSRSTRLHHVPAVKLDDICFGFYFSHTIQWNWGEESNRTLP